MARLLVLANPSASGFTGGLHRDVMATLSPHHEVEAAWPRTPEETRTMAADAARAGVELVVAFGGDGVVHHVANGLAGTDAVLGIIPAGTTNVVARLLRIPSRPRKAAQALNRGDPPTYLPLTSVETTDEQGSTEHRYSTFATGVGMDADVVEVAEREPYRKYRFGGLHYARSATEVVLHDYRGKRPDLVVRAAGCEMEAVGVLAQLHDRYTYFGRLPLGIAGHVPDTLSLLVLSALPVRVVPRIVAAAALGLDLDAVDGCTTVTGVTRVEVVAPGGVAAQADGEALGQITSLRARVEPDLIRVAIPRRR
jgi:diacylglycerol kinase family enzyme